MRKLFLIFMTLVACTLSLSAQTRTYHGTVLDASDNEPLVGATVIPVGGGQGTATDIDGKFTLTVPSGVKEAQISYVGYEPMKVALANDMVVKLKSTSQTLDDVMVVAFGTTTKEAFTGSAAVVDSKELQKRTTTNVTDALVGSVPGLQLRSSTGAPGASQGEIKIRGISSLYSSTQPLIIVDGAPYPDNLSNIPQSDIASVSVLKDAASAALYGARGASGVIIITTKKGANKEAQVSVSAKWGGNSRAVQDYDVITDPGVWFEAYYKQLYNYNFYGQGMSAEAANAAANRNLFYDNQGNAVQYNPFTIPEGQNLIGMDGKINPNATLGRSYALPNGQLRYLIPDNWTDEAYRTGFRQEYNMSINGGTDRANFYASLSYLDSEGIIKPSDFERISGRIRAEYKAKEWLKTGANIGYTHSATTNNSDIGTALSAGNILYYTGTIAPIYPMYLRSIDDKGNPFVMIGENGKPQYDFGVNTYLAGSRPFNAPGNPVGGQALDESKNILNQLNASVNATIDFTSYLKFDVVSSVSWLESQGTYYGSTYNPLNANVNGKLEKNTETTMRTNNTQTLTFYKDFGHHNVNVMLGHEYYRMQYTYLWAKGEGGFSPSILELNAFANRQFQAQSYKNRYNVEGWFGSVQYNYDQKYYGSASYRRDASSRFAKEHRWGNFWSVGGAWIVSKENFMENTRNWLDYLKFKVSIGQQGNDSMSSSYYWTTQYILNVANPKQMSPVFNMAFANPEITWETTTNLNVGLEFGVFNNRLSGNIDFYNKNTTNLLFWLSVPESTGGRGYYGNMGTIRNTGVELTLTGYPVKTKDLEWEISANISHNKSKIISLPYDKVKVNNGFYESPYWYEEGGEMYNYMTLAYAGVNDKGEALYYYDPNLEGSTSKPGTVKDMAYTTTESGNASRYVVGSVLPKAYGGFSTTLRYKWFDLTASFDYQIGGKLMDNRYSFLMSPNSSTDPKSVSGQNYHMDIFKSWSPDNKNSNIPRWQLGDRNTTASSDRFLTNAGYLNFQSFTVGFTLPKFFNDIEKIRIYCAGENLCFWSARKGFDPRFAFSGNESVGSYSPMRTVSGGIEVVF